MTVTKIIYFLRLHNGLDVIRIADDGLTLAENDFGHSDWNLEPSALSDETLNSIHQFCAQGSISLDWSAMAMRHF